MELKLELTELRYVTPQSEEHLKNYCETFLNDFVIPNVLKARNTWLVKYSNLNIV